MKSLERINKEELFSSGTGGHRHKLIGKSTTGKLQICIPTINYKYANVSTKLNEVTRKNVRNVYISLMGFSIPA